MPKNKPRLDLAKFMSYFKWTSSPFPTLISHFSGFFSNHTADQTVAPKFDSHFKEEQIAIIGLSCRFPGGAEDAAAYWKMLRDGIDGIEEIPASRWDVNAYYDPKLTTPGKMASRFGGFIRNVDRFDPDFFGVSACEAVSMDPQQRLLLEICWEALEHAGIAPLTLKGSQAGVFIGVSGSDYGTLLRQQGGALLDDYYLTGNALNMLPARIAFVLGLHGPCMAIDTACSSSLVALHAACQSLQHRECSLAISGGTNVILLPETTIALSQRELLLSPEGRCKAFDSQADGFVRSEGCGVVVLKRLADALNDGDPVLAIIRASSVNQGGHTSLLTVPNANAQEDLIRTTLAKAKIRPEEIDYIETHGMGIPLNDSIEMMALNAVFRDSHSVDKPLVIGSVKTNIGHSEASSGIASLIKVVLAMRNKTIPAHLHFKELNPAINLSAIPATIPTQASLWLKHNKSRMAGVSSFGYSGTNAHVLVEEGMSTPHVTSLVERPLHVLAVSAKTVPALHALVERYQEFFKRYPEAELSDIAFSANSSRVHFANRIAVIANNLQECSEKLRDLALSDDERPLPISPPKIAFLFTGQGTQYSGMGKELYDTNPVFKKSINYCESFLHRYLDAPLTTLLFSPDYAAKIDQTKYAQLCLFAFEYSLALVWMSWGIRPDFVMGHNIGEYIAATIAGVMSLEDALTLISDPKAAAIPKNAKKITYRDPEIPFISNLTGQVAAPGFINADYWNSHARGSIDFKDNLATLAAFKCNIFLEISPQPTLLNLDNELITESQSLWLPSLQRDRGNWAVLLESLATLYQLGVDVDWRGFDKPYHRQRIDIPTYAFQRQRYWPTTVSKVSQRTFDKNSKATHYQLDNKELYYELAWLPQPLDGLSNCLLTGHWLVLTDQPSLITALQNRGATCVTATHHDKFKRISATKFTVNFFEKDTFLKLMKFMKDYTLQGIIYAQSLDASNESWQEELPLITAGFLHLAQAVLLVFPSELPPITMVTLGAQAVKTGKLCTLAAAPQIGLRRALLVEHMELICRHIDLDREVTYKKNWAMLLDDLSLNKEEDQIAYSGGKRYILRLNQARTLHNPTVPIRFDATASYLITGGLGGLGLKVAEFMVSKGARHIVLLNRRFPTPEVEAEIHKWQSQGIEIEIVSSDVASPDAIATLFTEFGSKWPVLKGIFHTAGILADGTVLNLTWQNFMDVFIAKVTGTWNLHYYSQDIPLDFFVTFSSVAAVFGATGQANYSAANAFIDSLAYCRRASGMSALTMNWGPWAGTGTAENIKELAAIGMTPLLPAEGIKALEVLMQQSTLTQGIVVRMNWKRFAKQLPKRSKFFSHFVGNKSPTEANVQPEQKKSLDTISNKEELSAAELAALLRKK